MKAPPDEYEQVNPFTDAVIAALYAACNPNGWMGLRMRAVVSLLLDTGLRAGELCGLTLADVDLGERAQVTVRAATSKTRTGRSIGLGRRAKRDMGQWWARKRHLWEAERHSPWFASRNETPLTRTTLYTLLARHGRRAGVAGVHPHRFRRTAAVNALRAGMTPFALMRMLGHVDIAMTQRYVKYLEGDVAAEKRLHSPLDRLKLRGWAGRRRGYERRAPASRVRAR